MLLLEFALRIYNPVPVRVRGNEIVLPVKQVYTFDNGFTRKIDRTTVHTKNSLGFRGPDPPRDFADRLTIVTIGGSTTESLFLSDGQTWTDAMARRLEPDFPGVVGQQRRHRRPHHVRPSDPAEVLRRAAQPQGRGVSDGRQRRRARPRRAPSTRRPAGGRRRAPCGECRRRRDPKSSTWRGTSHGPRARAIAGWVTASSI